MKPVIKKKPRIRRLVRSAVLLGVMMAVVMLLTSTPYAVLYGGLTPEESSAVMARLEELGADARLSDTVITVPGDKLDELRWRLASEELLSHQPGAYAAYLGTAIGMTDDEKHAYRQAQMAEEIRSALLSYAKIQDAAVSVSLASASAYLMADETPASASVILKVEDDQRLTDGEAHTIAELLKSCVPGLAADNINITDSNMRVYNAAQASGSGAL